MLNRGLFAISVALNVIKAQYYNEYEGKYHGISISHSDYQPVETLPVLDHFLDEVNPYLLHFGQNHGQNHVMSSI